MVCNNLLWSVILELLENAKVKALEEGKKLGRKEEIENKKNTEKRAYENGWREGHESGLEEGREEREVKYKYAYSEGKAHGRLEEMDNWVSNHGEGLCASLKVSTPRIRTNIDVGTQATPRTDETASQTNNNPDRQCAALQTEQPDDDDPTALKSACVDFGTQATPQTAEMATQTRVETPNTFPNAATSPVATAPSATSTTTTPSSTTTTNSLPAPKPPPAPQKRHYTLPNQSTTPLPSPEPPFPHFSPQHHAVMSPSTMADVLAAPNSETTTWAMSSTQKLDDTLEDTTQTVNDTWRPPTAQEMELHKAMRMHSSECVAHLTKRPHSSQDTS